MAGLVESLRQYPEIAVFIAVGVGYWIGNFKIANFSLGTVTAALLAGLVIGNLEIEPSRDFRWGFFMLFLFANGYSVGPQFFHALKSDGVKPMLLSVVVCVTALATAYFLARMLQLDVGLAAGLFSGGTTQSAAIGTASDAIMGLPISDADKKLFVSHVAVADALCYVFGAIGVIWFCSFAAPWLLRIDLKAEAKALEEKLGIKEETDRLVFSRTEILCACIPPENRSPPRSARKVRDVETRILGATAFVHRIARNGEIIEALPDTLVQSGDTLVLYGHTKALVEVGSKIGHRDSRCKRDGFLNRNPENRHHKQEFVRAGDG